MSQEDGDEEQKFNAPSTIEDKLNAMQTFVDQKEFVVIDNGTGYLKCGFSGEDLPRVVTPTIMGVREIILEASQTNDQGGKKYSRVYGDEALANRSEYEIHTPIRRGIIEDFDTMKYCWQHLLSHKNMHNQKKCEILVTDSPLNHRDNKLKIAETLFEKIKDHVVVDSISIMNSAVLSLFASGRTSGVVIESGQGYTCAVPIFEGYALPHAIKSVNIAGQDVTQHLLDTLVSQGLDIDINSFDHIRKIKDQMCSVALNYDRAIKGADPLDEEKSLYELPGDKGIIQVDHKTRFEATELLFNPEIGGLKGTGIPQLAYDSIQK
jgi:actin-related protein